jgi:hypothetical protein
MRLSRRRKKLARYYVYEPIDRSGTESVTVIGRELRIGPFPSLLTQLDPHEALFTRCILSIPSSTQTVEYVIWTGESRIFEEVRHKVINLAGATWTYHAIHNDWMKASIHFKELEWELGEIFAPGLVSSRRRLRLVQPSTEGEDQ